jgi:hypothetical protein
LATNVGAPRIVFEQEASFHGARADRRLEFIDFSPLPILPETNLLFPDFSHIKSSPN